jgi:hypothetical protein
MRTLVSVIGITLFILGGAAMDSASLIVPACMVLTGLGLVTVSTKGEY